MSVKEASVFPLQIDGSKDHLPAVPFPGRSPKDMIILLPQYVFIKDRDGRYLCVRQSSNYATLTFRYGEVDDDCSFAAPIQTDFPGWYHLISARTGNYRNWPFLGPSFYVIAVAENKKFYLKDNYSPSLFLSNELDSTGSPLGRSYINPSCEMEIITAALKTEIYDIEYDIDGAKVREAAPVVALSTSVRNDSDGDVNQTLSYAYEKWSSGTWNNTLGIEIGASMTFKAGVPFIASAEFEISITASYSHEWGGETGVRQTVTSSTQVTVPPKKKARATVIVRNAQLDVGFAYMHKFWWPNGQVDDEVKTGVYTNLDSWHVDVVLGNWEDI